MDTTKRKGRFTDTRSEEMDVTADIEVRKPRVQRGDYLYWNDLPNELLLHIFQYLPHGDLQQIRIVCKRWHSLAQLPEFLNGSKLVVTSRNVETLFDCLLADDQLADRLSIYSSVEFHDLDSSEELQFILRKLGKNICTLRLQNSPVFWLLETTVPNLEEITLTNIPIMPIKFEDSSFRLSEFSKLKAVDIACTDLHLDVRSHMLMELACDDGVVRLERLCVHMTPKDEDLLIAALHYHTSTLQHLEILLLSPPVMFSKWKHIFVTLDQLSTLKVTGNSCYSWLRDCFENIPQRAPITALDLSGGLQVIDSLLIYAVRKWYRSLQTLDLMLCNSLTDESIVYLGLLGESLTTVNLSHCSRITTRGLLHGLVRKTNFKLKSLVLNDIIDADADGVCLLAQRLPNLTYLNLESCRDAVTDFTLAKIFRYQTLLQHLILDDCMRITDEGLLGFGRSPAAIHNLKGLRSLSLRGCRNLSNRAVGKALKFSELRKLVLGYCHKISSMGIEELVENCPALEDLTISSCLMIDDDAMLHMAQGLPRLRRLNVSNCINLTGKSIDYVVEICKSLRELSMCGIDSLELQEVQDKFLLMRPKVVMVNL